MTFIGCWIAVLAMAQNATISIIDFYGNRNISEKQLREKLGIHEGDSMSFDELEAKRNSAFVQLKSIPGVKNVAMEFICCDDKNRQWMVFVGIDEGDAAVLKYHKTPNADLSVPADILADYRANDSARQLAVARGAAREDHSKGHALSEDSSVRYWQNKFVVHANSHFNLLKNILRNARDDSQRAAAAHIIAYATDKGKVLPELLYAVYDSSDLVRNNATRAIGVLAVYAQQNPRAGFIIPAGPFIQLANSLTWTDRNKGTMVLMSLTQKRDKKLLDHLKQETLPALIEMAKWKNPSHAYFSFLILGRIAGIREDDLYKALFGGEKEKLFVEMEQKIKTAK